MCPDFRKKIQKALKKQQHHRHTQAREEADKTPEEDEESEPTSEKENEVVAVEAPDSDISAPETNVAGDTPLEEQ